MSWLYRNRHWTDQRLTCLGAGFLKLMPLSLSWVLRQRQVLSLSFYFHKAGRWEQPGCVNHLREMKMWQKGHSAASSTPKEWLGTCMAQSPPVLGSISLRKVKGVPGAEEPLTTLLGRHGMWLTVSGWSQQNACGFSSFSVPSPPKWVKPFHLLPCLPVLTFFYLLPDTPGGTWQHGFTK